MPISGPVLEVVEPTSITLTADYLGFYWPNTGADMELWGYTSGAFDGVLRTISPPHTPSSGASSFAGQNLLAGDACGIWVDDNDSTTSFFVVAFQTAAVLWVWDLNEGDSYTFDLDDQGGVFSHADTSICTNCSGDHIAVCTIYDNSSDGNRGRAVVREFDVSTKALTVRGTRDAGSSSHNLYVRAMSDADGANATSEIVIQDVNTGVGTWRYFELPSGNETTMTVTADTGSNPNQAGLFVARPSESSVGSCFSVATNTMATARVRASGLGGSTWSDGTNELISPTAVTDFQYLAWGMNQPFSNVSRYIWDEDSTPERVIIALADPNDAFADSWITAAVTETLPTNPADDIANGAPHQLYAFRADVSL